MQYADKTLTCRDCNSTFVFTSGEQEFYASRGFEQSACAAGSVHSGLAKNYAQQNGLCAGLDEGSYTGAWLETALGDPF